MDRDRSRRYEDGEVRRRDERNDRPRSPRRDFYFRDPRDRSHNICSITPSGSSSVASATHRPGCFSKLHDTGCHGRSRTSSSHPDRTDLNSSKSNNTSNCYVAYHTSCRAQGICSTQRWILWLAWWTRRVANRLWPPSLWRGGVNIHAFRV
ncbi:hypothetical protein P8C59_006229 [Phyllachora maydis]|uniref:Uncharacterized protein n=1 Tax=Phyllachora maydis TaxID=1825666 RepID=A0AAD9I5W8_9PEZI|nr:hypothetical protein P8C59_006229 [Phyllachora maydis]